MSATAITYTDGLAAVGAVFVDSAGELEGVLAVDDRVRRRRSEL